MTPLNPQEEEAIAKKLATELMQWHWKPYGIVECIGGWFDKKGEKKWEGEFDVFNDWNAWRVVEEKVMEDKKLRDMLWDIIEENRGICTNPINVYITLSLCQKCLALVSALDTLKSQ